MQQEHFYIHITLWSKSCSHIIMGILQRLLLLPALPPSPVSQQDKRQPNLQTLTKRKTVPNSKSSL